MRSAMRMAWLTVGGVLLVAQGACGSGVGPDDGLPALVEIEPAAIRVELQSSFEVGATLKDAAGNVLDGRPVHWSTEDSDIATVSPAGVVTGNSLGKTRIAASAAGVDGLAEVTVVPRSVASVVVSPASANLILLEAQQFDVTARAADGSTLTGRAVTWSSSNTSVATVTKDGLVRATGPGTARIDARVEGATGSANITVSLIPVASVTVSPSSTTLNVGQTKQFDATLKSLSGSTLTERSVAWTSSKPQVASVNENGRATAHAAGETVITATSEGKSGTATVRVRSSSVDDD